jgi:hypothetical protein
LNAETFPENSVFTPLQKTSLSATDNGQTYKQVEKF